MTFKLESQAGRDVRRFSTQSTAEKPAPWRDSWRVSEPSQSASSEDRAGLDGRVGWVEQKSTAYETTGQTGSKVLVDASGGASARGLTPSVRSDPYESPTRPRQWAKEDRSGEATTPHPRADHPQAARGRADAGRGPHDRGGREGARGLREHLAPLAKPVRRDEGVRRQGAARAAAPERDPEADRRRQGVASHPPGEIVRA